MGKRSSFERNPRDYYKTPEKAVLALLPHLPAQFVFSEPCAGDGTLTKWLNKYGGHTYWESDIEPQAPNIQQADALRLTKPLIWSKLIITNPPWRRDILHPMIEHFRDLAETWLLFDADWAHTQQASPYIKYCNKIVSVGRLRWMEGSKMDGKDNCAWYNFGPDEAIPKFYGR